MQLDALRDSLATLSERVDEYRELVRTGGFTTCLVNEDWIERHCDADAVKLHRRYLAESAREMLLGTKPEDIIYSDALNCKSHWLNELKAKRLAEQGPVEQLKADPQALYLSQLSPCLREVIRVSSSHRSADKKQVAQQQAEFVRRREGELAQHYDDIQRICARLPDELEEVALQAWFAQQLYSRLEKWGAALTSMVRPEGRVNVLTFRLTGNAVFAINPNMIVRSREASGRIPTGRLSVAFRLMDEDVVRSPVFLRDRQLVVRLASLLPNEFNDYGLFEGREELGLNVLAWQAGLAALMVDVTPRLTSGFG